MSDIDTAVVDSLKVLDPNRPIREATVSRQNAIRRYVPEPEAAEVEGAIYLDGFPCLFSASAA